MTVQSRLQAWSRDNVERVRQLLLHKPRKDDVRPGMRRAAVLFPLMRQDGRLTAIYIRRTRHFLRDGREAVHSGQIAFPGGKIEAGESPLQAALREGREEIGLLPEQIELLGELGLFATLASFIMANVYVCWLAEIPTLQRQHREVAAVYKIPLDEIYPQHRRELSLDHLSDVLSLHYHWQPPDESKPICIWGMTARMTWYFFHLLEHALR